MSPRDSFDGHQAQPTQRKIMRAYKYRAFAPADAVAEFDRAIELKRALWKRLIEIEKEYNRRKSLLLGDPADHAAAYERAASIKDKAGRKAAIDALRAAKQKRVEAAKPALLLLGSWRVNAQKLAKQEAAARGLHWGDYNAAVFQFEGARTAAKARGAQVYNFEKACGEAIVNQIMNGRRPAQLHQFLQCRLSFKDDPNTGRRKAGSHRAGYRLGCIDMTLRGPRNPHGPARLSVDFVMHRPLPPDAMVKEVRVIRTWKRVVNKDGRCFSRAEWSVVFVSEMHVAARADKSCCGLSLTWRGDGSDDGIQTYALLFDGTTTKSLTMDFGYEADWSHRAELILKAAESGDDADRVVAETFERKLLRRRQIAQREAAAQIARRFAVVAMQKIDLSQKGAKRHTAPASFRLALRCALESRGGTLIEVAAPLDHQSDYPHKAQAKKLYAAAKAFFSSRQDENLAMLQEHAA